MGSRGAFQDVDTGKFNFVENGQNYHAVGGVDGVQVILQNSGAVKAPEYSHSAERAYAIVQNGKLKHLSFYLKLRISLSLRNSSLLRNPRLPTVSTNWKKKSAKSSLPAILKR